MPTIEEMGEEAVTAFNDRMKAVGVDVVELSIAFNVQAFCVDMANSLSYQIESMMKKAGLFKVKRKQNIKKMKDLSDELVADITRDIKSFDQKVAFGYDSDFMKEVLELSVQIPIENRLKATSSLKLLIRK